MNSKNPAFAPLRRALFLRALALVLAAVASVLFLRELFRGKAGDWIVYGLQKILRIDCQAAVELYFNYIRRNLDVLLAILVLLFMLLLYWLLLRSFQSYFLQIARGIAQIVDGGEPIVLPSELRYVEQQLNRAQRTLHQREQELWQKERQKNDMIAYLAHDIRTPLTSVIGYLGLLEDPSAPPEKQRYLCIARKKADRLGQMVDEFFELTRYAFQSVPLHKTRVDLSYMLVQIADELYPQLEAEGKTLQTHIQESLQIWGDTDKLARVFNNILRNAILYGQAGDTICIDACERMGSTIITFRNHGGIPAELLEKIFEKFYRADPARTSRTGGTGLGLAIARDIVQLHGGTIRAESSDGETIFTVSLPQPLPD